MSRFGSAVFRVDERIPGIDLPLMSVSQTHGVVRRSELTDKPARAESLDVYKVCRAGDIVFNKMSVRAGAMGVAAEDGLVTYHYEVMRPFDHTEARFITYLMKSAWFTGELVSRERGIGAGEQGANVRTTEVPFKVMRTVDCWLPPLEEQRAIADYLDRETARIDTLITKQEQLIEKLTERRSTLIADLVCGSSIATTRRRSSGLTWAGPIPDYWDVVNIRRVAQMRTGHTPSRSIEEYWEEVSIPWFTLADVWQLRSERQVYLGETKSKISELGLANSAAELLPAGTVVLSRTASVGFTGIMPAPMATSQDYWNWVCGDRLLPEYLMYTFRAIRPYLLSLMTGSTHQTIYQPIAASIHILLPPLSEQKQIVHEIHEQTGKIDLLIEKTRAFIALAKERRSALITAVVTGQIDVREAA